MDSFLIKFFQSVYAKEKEMVETNQYCKFDSELLTLFTSSLYLALRLRPQVRPQDRHARRRIELICATILVGDGAGEDAGHVEHQLLAHDHRRHPRREPHQLLHRQDRRRVGLAHQPGPRRHHGRLLHLPPRHPQLGPLPWQGGRAHGMLRGIRGTDDVGPEYDDLVAASEASKAIENPWSTLLEHRYRPQLVMSVLIPTLQQLTGVNIVMSAVIAGLVNMFVTFVSIATVDRLSRRKLLLQGGIQMICAQAHIRLHHRADLPDDAVPPQVRALLLLRRHGAHHDGVRLLLPPGDEGDGQDLGTGASTGTGDGSSAARWRLPLQYDRRHAGVWRAADGNGDSGSRDKEMRATGRHSWQDIRERRILMCDIHGMTVGGRLSHLNLTAEGEVRATVDAMLLEMEGQAMARCSVWKKKKKKKRAKPMPDDKGWKREGKGSKKMQKAKLHMPNPDDDDDEVADAGSKVEEAAHPPATATVTMELDLIEYYLVDEVVDYMMCAPLCPILELMSITHPLFDPAALAPFEKEEKFSANILKQHRLTDGPVELQMDPIATTDDHEEKRDCQFVDRMGWKNWRTPEERRKRILEEEQEELEDEARWNKLKEEA
uniref:Major facilitator superfamily (MFS) profile domain-containing protein n=1 Tax=Oryza punctata TaxID=4537 RepID=A0A0E0M959_ORYPU